MRFLSSFLSALLLDQLGKPRQSHETWKGLLLCVCRHVCRFGGLQRASRTPEVYGAPSAARKQNHHLVKGNKLVAGGPTPRPSAPGSHGLLELGDTHTGGSFLSLATTLLKSHSWDPTGGPQPKSLPLQSRRVGRCLRPLSLSRECGWWHQRPAPGEGPPRTSPPHCAVTARAEAGKASLSYQESEQKPSVGDWTSKEGFYFQLVGY